MRTVALSFRSVCLLFTFLALVSASRRMVSSRGESRRHDFVPHLGEKPSLFHHCVSCIYLRMLTVDFSVEAPFQVEKMPFSYRFAGSIYHEWVLNFVKCFFCIHWHNHVVFVKPFVWWNTSIDFGKVEQPFVPGINHNWLWCAILSTFHVAGFDFLVFC